MNTYTIDLQNYLVFDNIVIKEYNDVKNVIT